MAAPVVGQQAEVVAHQRHTSPQGAAAHGLEGMAWPITVRSPKGRWAVLVFSQVFTREATGA